MGSQTPIYGIPFPVGTDRVMDGDNAMEAIARAVETLLNLPPAVRASYAATNAITATTWANLPSRLSVALTLARPALVAITFGGWLALSSVTTNADVRLGVLLTGATSEAPPGLGWGDIGYNSAAAGNTQTIGATVTVFKVFNAGTTTAELQAMKSGTATTQINYPTITAVPLRYTA